MSGKKLEGETEAALLRVYVIEAKRQADAGEWEKSPILERISRIWRSWPVIKKDDVEFIQLSRLEYYSEKLGGKKPVTIETVGSGNIEVKEEKR